MKPFVTCLALVLSGSLVSAQQRPPVDSAGEPHAVLLRFIGEWEGQVRTWRGSDSTTPPAEGTVTLTAEMVMGGRFLVEKVKSISPRGPIEAVRITGYDNITHRYQRAMYSNFETGIMQQVGERNPAEELVFTNTYTDPGTGETATRRVVRRAISDSEWIETAFESRSGTERKVSEIRARRKA